MLFMCSFNTDQKNFVIDTFYPNFFTAAGKLLYMRDDNKKKDFNVSFFNVYSQKLDTLGCLRRSKFSRLIKIKQITCTNTHHA